MNLSARRSNIVILLGLDGTGLLLAECRDLLTPYHAVHVMRYPADLVAYDDIQRWLIPRLPSDDYTIVAESFSGPLAVSIGATEPANLQGIVFAKLPKLMWLASLSNWTFRASIWRRPTTC